MSADAAPEDERTVRDLMQRDVATLEADDTLDLADDVMRLGRIRRFPIMAHGELVGVLSQRVWGSGA
jgi:CBS domain-containing protein